MRMQNKRKINEAIEAPKNELEALISGMDADQISDDDYIDSETGEFYLEKGKPARSSFLHLQSAVDADASFQKRRKEHEEEDAEWEAESDRSYEDAQQAYESAMAEYASNWTNWRDDMGVDDGEEHSVAMDAAEGFFHQYPDWKSWARELELSKDDIQSAVADFVYQAMSTGTVDF